MGGAVRFPRQKRAKGDCPGCLADELDCGDDVYETWDIFVGVGAEDEKCDP